MRTKHYAQASLLWQTKAYVDQWNQIMIICDSSGNPRFVIAPHEAEDAYFVLAIGDDKQVLYLSDDVELGTMKSNMKSIFNLYLQLTKTDGAPRFTPDGWATKTIPIHACLTHTRVGIYRHGNFRGVIESEHIRNIIDNGKKLLTEALNSAEAESIILPDVPYRSSFRQNGTEMYHVGDGAYCDDDGDNWVFA